MKIVDIHAHLGNWMYPISPVSPEKFISYMDLYRIEHSIISSSSAILYDFIEGNQELLNTIKKHSRLWGYIVVNPHYLDESFRELDKYKDETKFVGVKFHPESNAYNMNAMNSIKLLKYISDAELPILVHTFGKEQVNNIGKAAAICPRLKIIMGHMGGDTWQDGINIASQYNNLYLEPCCSFPDTDKISMAVNTIGAERVLFGSDSELLNPGLLLVC